MNICIFIIISLLNFLGIILLFIKLNKRNFELENLILAQAGKLDQLGKNQERIESGVKEEIACNRAELKSSAKEEREELRTILCSFENSLLNRLKESENSQKNQLDTFSRQLSMLTQLNEQKLEKVREVVEIRLKSLQEENNQRLEEMRVVVDEKLHNTLEKRLSEKFKLVSDSLESVYKGLGEMQALASNVGDLKRVLTNVKVRGTWGEIQLGSLLEQILTSEQYSSNVVTKKGSSERVEFAVKLPGRDKDISECVWLPIDAKFPQEDYQRLLEAQEQANLDLMEKIAKQLEIRIKTEAKNIKDKYLDPPYTTDFGIMFLPTEGLYAEVLRRSGLCELLQRDYRIIVTGPTTLGALLNSLQMGFRTLVIEKRSSEVWQLLGVVKSEFAKFGDILDKTKKKLEEAANTIDDAAKKTRTIQSKLKNVQELPACDSTAVIEQIPGIVIENADKS